jgi:hypothetical protein
MFVITENIMKRPVLRDLDMWIVDTIFAFNNSLSPLIALKKNVVNIGP